MKLSVARRAASPVRFGGRVAPPSSEAARRLGGLVPSQPVGLTGSLAWRRPRWKAEHPEPETAMGFVCGCVCVCLACGLRSSCCNHNMPRNQQTLIKAQDAGFRTNKASHAAKQPFADIQEKDQKVGTPASSQRKGEPNRGGTSTLSQAFALVHASSFLDAVLLPLVWRQKILD